MIVKCGWCARRFESTKPREVAGSLEDPCSACNELTAAELQESYPVTFERWERQNAKHAELLRALGIE